MIKNGGNELPNILINVRRDYEQNGIERRNIERRKNGIEET